MRRLSGGRGGPFPTVVEARQGEVVLGLAGIAPRRRFEVPACLLPGRSGERAASQQPGGRPATETVEPHHRGVEPTEHEVRAGMGGLQRQHRLRLAVQGHPQRHALATSFEQGSRAEDDGEAVAGSGVPGFGACRFLYRGL